MALLEICVYSAADARIAARAGAERIELCREPSADGLTPTDAELVAGAERSLALPVHPIVRPRARFTASSDDAEAMASALQRVQELGFPGAVIGVLDDSLQAPDWPLLASLMAAAEGLAMTFHRAFDLVSDQPETLRRLADLGFARVLTSGRPGRAAGNLHMLAELADLGRDIGITVMAGGGVTATDVPALVDAGIQEIHASAGGSRGTMSEAEVRALAAAARATAS